MASKVCILCGAPGPLTREHVWPEWYSELSPDLNYICRIHGGEEEREFGSGSLDLQPRVLCGPCNNTWGGKNLEPYAKRILGPILKGDSRTLLFPQIRYLVTFATLKMMVYEWVGNKENPFFTSEDGLRLHKHRQPPLASRMWIGRYVGEMRQSGRISGEVTLVSLFPPEGKSAGKIQTHLLTCTYTIGEVLFQLFALKRTEEVRDWFRRDLIEGKFSHTPGPWSKALASLNPMPAEPVKWPPTLAFDDAGFGILAHRFSYDLQRKTVKKPPWAQDH